MRCFSEEYYECLAEFLTIIKCTEIYLLSVASLLVTVEHHLDHWNVFPAISSTWMTASEFSLLSLKYTKGYQNLPVVIPMKMTFMEQILMTIHQIIIEGHYSLYVSPGIKLSARERKGPSQCL